MSAPQSKKRKFWQDNKKYLNYKSNGRDFLEPGNRGFLATCNFHENECVQEAYNILHHYAEDLYGRERQVTETISEEDEAPVADDIVDEMQKDKGDSKNDLKEKNTELEASNALSLDDNFGSERQATEAKVSGESEAPVGVDVSEDLQKEIDAATVSRKEQKGDVKERFEAVDTGAINCIFIRTTLADPVELVMHIVNDILETQELKTRYLLRLLPVEVVCLANLTDITTAGSLLFDKHFMEESTFSIIFNKRFNTSVSREDVTRELATLVKSKNINNSVNLKEATKTVVVEVVNNLCCISVLEGYLRYKKFNLLELANCKRKQDDTEDNLVRTVDLFGVVKEKRKDNGFRVRSLPMTHWQRESKERLKALEVAKAEATKKPK